MTTNSSEALASLRRALQLNSSSSPKPPRGQPSTSCESDQRFNRPSPHPEFQELRTRASNLRGSNSRGRWRRLSFIADENETYRLFVYKRAGDQTNDRDRCSVVAGLAVVCPAADEYSLSSWHRNAPIQSVAGMKWLLVGRFHTSPLLKPAHFKIASAQQALEICRSVLLNC